MIVTCSNCNGRGTAPLSDALQATLDALKSIGEGAAVDVYQSLGGKRRTHVGVTAINNRLNDLLVLRLVTREKRGRRAVFAVAEHLPVPAAPPTLAARHIRSLLAILRAYHNDDRGYCNSPCDVCSDIHVAAVFVYGDDAPAAPPWSKGRAPTDCLALVAVPDDAPERV